MGSVKATLTEEPVIASLLNVLVLLSGIIKLYYFISLQQDYYILSVQVLCS